MSAETPVEQNPWRSGGLTWTSAQSTSPHSRPVSCRKTGTKSARPSATASRTFGAIKNVVTRKLRAYSGAT
jgi:hypothetical protein